MLEKVKRSTFLLLGSSFMCSPEWSSKGSGGYWIHFQTRTILPDRGRILRGKPVDNTNMHPFIVVHLCAFVMTPRFVLSRSTDLWQRQRYNCPQNSSSRRK